MKGGFKAFMVQVEGKGTSATTNDIKTILDDILNGIINTNQGWSKDTSKYGSNPIVTIKSGECLAHFLVHNNGTKLMIAMNLSDHTVFNPRSYFNYEMTSETYDGSIFGGLMISMIPKNISGDFDLNNSSNESFLPRGALRILGTCGSFSSSPSVSSFLANPSVAGKFLNYLFCIKDDTIIFSYKRTDVNSCWLMVIGNIVSPYDSDDEFTYGSLFMIRPGSTFSEDGVGDYLLHNFDENFSNSISQWSTLQLYSKNGSNLYAGRVTITSSEYLDMAIPRCFYNSIVCKGSSFRGNCKTVPYDLIITSDDGTVPGVTSSNAYKGIINPEIILKTPNGSSTYNNIEEFTPMDNGNYLHLCQGVIIGWDSTNSVLF